MKKTESVKIRGRMLDASWILKIKHVFHIWEVERKEVDIRRNEGEDFHPHLNIALKGFRFYHTASSSEGIDSKYIHRPKFEEKLKNWLTEESGHGVYLVTGYRGTGKSSLVGSVIKDLEKESGTSKHRERNKFKFSFVFKFNLLWLKIRSKQIAKNRGKKYVDVCINIGQENINEIDFLRVLAKTLRDKLVAAVRWGASRWSWYIIVSELKRLQAIVGLFVGGVIALLLEFRNEYPGHCIFSGILFAIFMFAMMLVACYIGGALGQVRMILHLERLCKNLYAVTRYERGIEGGGIFKGIISKAREVPPATAQEIEYELINILNIAKKHFSIIIVLDELDKFDKVNSGEVEGQDLGEGEDVLKQSGQYVASQIRRQRVLAMIANMKYFLSTAPAYFIFIGGRELYEAAMADISDREFAIGNLFNGILQIDSFYTRKGLSDAIDLAEEFVCRQIDKEAYDLGELYEKQCVNQEQLVFLYRFICYLAFISHGSPKKIAVFFEKYVRSPKYLRAHQNSDIESSDALWYLSFRDHQQMKINFVHYLAFPILQNIMNRSAILGDKLRVAESFIFAHIVKLHNGGFSWRNIEQIPEVMAINRAPEVRAYIRSILMNMQQTLIKPVICGLYAYKFPLKMAEEISYFSKLSDELSALLNFSVGELQPVKEHYFALLDKLPVRVDSDGTYGKLHRCEHIYAEASIRHALGDIYMQEENFSAAIRQFERCVELVTPLLIKPTAEEHRQLQNYVLFYYRTMLKLGLAHEKRHTDNSAYAVYGDLLRVLFEVKANYPKFVAPLFRDNRGLHLGILAQLYVLERMGTTGITCNHIAEAIGRLGALYQFRLNGKRVAVCNPIVRADFYRKLGDIMFYKNLKCDECGNPAIRAYEKGITVLLAGNGLEGGDFWQKICGYIASQRRIKGKNERGDKMWIHSLAVLFESLGHAYVGISRFDDLKSEGGQIAWIFNKIIWEERGGDESQCNGFDVGNAGTFAKGLYCYWVSAKLYDISGENPTAIRCYKHLLSAFELYVKCYGNKKISVIEKNVLNNLLDVADFIIRQMIILLYKSYEYVNMLEWDWFVEEFMGRNNSKEIEKSFGNKLRSDLSVYVDIEDAAYAYFRLLIAYYHIDSGVGFGRVRTELHRALLHVRKISAVANSTLTTMINRHRLILCIYKCYLFDLLGKHGVNAWSVPSDIFGTEVKDFIEGRNGVHLSNFVIAIGGWKIWKKFCGIKNNEFKARKGTYKLGGNAVGLREVGINKYRFEVLNSILPDAIRRSDEILKWMVGPLQVTTLFNHTFQGNVYNDYAIFLKLYRQLEKYAKDNRIGDFNDVFNGRVQKPKYANEDYLAERALQSYIKVQECHRQGQAYQDLIQQLYLLEDDFNNDTIQFYLATERMALTNTEEKARKLRKESEIRTNYYWLSSYESIEEV